MHFQPCFIFCLGGVVNAFCFSVDRWLQASLINFSFQIWQYGLQYVLLDDGRSALGVSALDVASCVGVMLGAAIAMGARINPRPIKAALSVLIAQIMASAGLIAGTTGSASAALAIAVFSLPMPLASASIQGEIFTEVPNEMQGRARSVFNVVAQGFSLGAPLAASYLSVHGAEFSICMVSALPVVLALAIACLAA